jgi:sucrose-6-phosphate hydrolase SacC (GH32 family)
MASKIKVDTLETANGSGTIALSNQLSGMTTASLPALGSAQMPTGSVLQVQYMYTGAVVTATSQTYIDLGVNVSITPTSTSSKIMAFANVGGCVKTANSGAYMALQIVRDSTSIHIFEGQGGYNAANQPASFGTCAGIKLDSPNTTSAVNYKIQMKNLGGAGSVINNNAGALSSITLMEIQG